MINFQRLIICCLLFAAVLAGEEKSAEEAELERRIAVFEGGLSDAIRMIFSKTKTDSDPLDGWKKLSQDIKALALPSFDNCMGYYLPTFREAGKTTPKCALISSRRFVRDEYLKCRKGWVDKDEDRKEIDNLYKNGEFLDIFASVMIKYENSGRSYEISQFVVELLPTYHDKSPSNSKAYVWGGAIEGKPRESKDIKKDKKHLKYFEDCLKLYNKYTQEKSKLSLEDWKKLPEDIRVLVLRPFEMYLKLNGLTFDKKISNDAAISAYTAFSETLSILADNCRKLVEAATNPNLLQKYNNIIKSQKYLNFIVSFCIECEKEKVLNHVLKSFYSENSSAEATALQEKVLEFLGGYPECEDASTSTG